MTYHRKTIKPWVQKYTKVRCRRCGGPCHSDRSKTEQLCSLCYVGTGRFGGRRRGRKTVIG
jgi:formylmethanofuran dehydrogenase subunit E